MNKPSVRGSLGEVVIGLLAVLALVALVTGTALGQADGSAPTMVEPTEPAPAEPALNPQQEAVAVRIFNELISPCCWTTTVAQHGSGAAPRIQAEVRVMIAQGRSYDEIIAHYVQEYGERILASPSKTGFNLAAYIVPYVALAIGAGAVVLLVHRSRKRTGGARTATSAAPEAIGAAGSPAGPQPARGSARGEPAGSVADYKKRLEEELKRTS